MDISRDDEDITMENLTCVRPPIALDKHRSCPGRVNGSGHISSKTRLPTKSVAGRRENMMCTNSQITYRSCPEQINDIIHISSKPQLLSKNVAGHIIFGSVFRNHELNDIPEPRALFYDTRDDEATLRETMTPGEKKTSPPVTEAVAPVGEEEYKAQATVTDGSAVVNKASDPTKNEKGQETLNTLEKHGFVSSLTSDCITYDSRISTDDSSNFSNSIIPTVSTEEVQMQKNQESLEEAGVEVLQAFSQSSYMSSDVIVKNSLSFDGSGVHIIFDTTSDDISSEYDLRSVMVDETSTATSLLNEMRDTQNNSHDGEASTVQVANTKKYLAERRKLPRSTRGDVKTMKSQRAERRIFYDTLADADILASEESYDSYNLQHAFQLFTRYVTKKVNSRNTPAKAMDKMVFM